MHSSWFSRAKFTTAATASASCGCATTAGRWSIARFHAARAESQRSSPGLISWAAFSICVPSGHLFWVRHRVRCGSVEYGYRSDLLEELEGVQFVPVLLQTAVADPPDVDRVQLDLGVAWRHAHERARVASAVREAAD